MGVKPGLENLDTRKAYVQVKADIGDDWDRNDTSREAWARYLRQKKTFYKRCLAIVDGTHTVDYDAITIAYQVNSHQSNIYSCFLGHIPVDDTVVVDDDAMRKLRSEIQEDLDKMS